MKTRKEVVEYLIAQGAPLNLARAAVNECYNYDDTVETNPGLIRGQDEEDLTLPTEVTPELAMMMYNTMEEMMKVTPHGIELDGELLYDTNGHHLEYDSTGEAPL